jgi:hypothetical protein
MTPALPTEKGRDPILGQLQPLAAVLDLPSAIVSPEIITVAAAAILNTWKRLLPANRKNA